LVSCETNIYILQGIQNLALQYFVDSLKKDIVGKLNGFCDSDWGVNVDIKRSTTSYIFFFGRANVFWASKK
jgi:hypothetical protein